MTKAKGKTITDGPTRERTISWHDDQSRFMLGWYIDYKKEQHADFKFKRLHHHKCMEALKGQFGLEVTATQVERHFRVYKDNWNSIARALSNSGNGFDKTRCMVTISESEKPRLKDVDRRLFAKPIKFFDEMRELFSESTANGSLAKDALNCMVDNEESDDSEDNDISLYAAPEDVPEDSDTLAIGGDEKSSSSSKAKRPVEKIDHSNNSSSSGVKRQCSISSKKGGKQNRTGKSADEISSTLHALQVALAVPPPPPPPPSCDPHTALWERIHAMTITTDQKLIVGTFLAKKENKGLRSFLCAYSEITLQTWVFQYLSGTI